MKEQMRAALEKAAIEWDKESPSDQFASEVFDDGFKRAWDHQQSRIKELESQVSGLEAARFAYASEFALDEEGMPDKGSIHQNIRKLKADYAQLETELADAKKDQARYQWIRQAGAWESEVGLDLLSGRPELFDEAVDAELALIKDQSNG